MCAVALAVMFTHCGGDKAGDSKADAASAEDATLDAQVDDAGDAATGDVAQPDASQPDASQPDGGAAVPGCKSDKDCKDAGQVCDPLTKTCVTCLEDADCGDSEHCEAKVCVGFTACTNSLGCKDANDLAGGAQPICDKSIGECVTCLEAADCPTNHDCTDNACTPYIPCKNSTDCGADEVCDKGAKRCVQCLVDADCGADALCEAGVCRAFTPCDTDKTCTPMGMLCDKAKGKCAQCLSNEDCPDIYHCESAGVDKTGQCALDVCAQGQGACSNNAKVTCNQVGDGYDSPAPCGAKTTCLTVAGQPGCKPWVCEPGVKSCDGAKVSLCADDGLNAVVELDCAQQGALCKDGACKLSDCDSKKTACVDSETLATCAGPGTDWVQTKCPSGQVCAGGACLAKVCDPGKKSCVGKQVAICNASGTKFTPGDDCESKNQVCDAGACVSAQSGLMVRGGFMAAGDAQVSGLRVIDQGFLVGRSCAGGMCQQGGFVP